MVEFMEEFMEEILALSCCNSFWVVEKSNENVLRHASISWLHVWDIVKGVRWVHTKNGLWENGITTIREKRGIQWDRSQVRGSGPQEKKG
jgi:hypothetical protein